MHGRAVCQFSSQPSFCCFLEGWSAFVCCPQVGGRTAGRRQKEKERGESEREGGRKRRPCGLVCGRVDAACTLFLFCLGRVGVSKCFPPLPVPLLPLSLLLCVSAFVSICLHALSSDLSPTCARACLLCACTRCRTAVCCCAAPRLAPQRHARIHPQWEPHASPCPASNQRRQPCPSPCSPRYALAFADHTKREVVVDRVCTCEGNGEEARCLIVHAYTHMSTPVLRFLCHGVQNCCL